jgi:uncharacterized protein YdhG (YjbR/CyaY superfamily)
LPVPQGDMSYFRSLRKMNKSAGVTEGRSDTAESNDVDAYIAKCPKEIQGKLKEVRAAIREAAPGATETMSYFDIPGYSYPGYDYNGMFAWFSFKRPYIGLHVRPPAIQNHEKELAGYATTKAIVRIPLDKRIPVPLVKKLVRASVRIMKDKAKSGIPSKPRN